MCYRSQWWSCMVFLSWWPLLHVPCWLSHNVVIQAACQLPIVFVWNKHTRHISRTSDAYAQSWVHHLKRLCLLVICILIDVMYPLFLSLYALENGHWTGDIPDKLAILNLPECLLFGRYITAVYIIRLYPWWKGANNWDTNSMNSGVWNLSLIFVLLYGHVTWLLPNQSLDI